MKTRHHLSLAAICIVLWLLFYLVGLPYNYFQEFNTIDMLQLLLITFFSVIPFIVVITLSFIKRPFFSTSVWFAFYASLPVFILDYIFVGIIAGEGLNFLFSHWYLTLGYIAVWIEIPIIGKTLEQLSIKIINQNV